MRKGRDSSPCEGGRGGRGRNRNSLESRRPQTTISPSEFGAQRPRGDARMFSGCVDGSAVWTYDAGAGGEGASACCMTITAPLLLSIGLFASLGDNFYHSSGYNVRML